MSTKTLATFKTTTDMIEWSMANTYNAHMRFLLDISFSLEWDDPQAGEAWTKRSDANEIPYRHQFKGNDGKVDEKAYEKANLKYERKESRLNKTRPSQHRVVHYKLEESGRRWDYNYIELDPALGEQLEKVWPTRDRYPRSRFATRDTVRCGHFTVPGLLKKLNASGSKELSKQLKAAQEEAIRKSIQLKKDNGMVAIAKLRRSMMDEINRHDISTRLQDFTFNGQPYIIVAINSGNDDASQGSAEAEAFIARAIEFYSQALQDAALKE